MVCNLRSLCWLCIAVLATTGVIHTSAEAVPFPLHAYEFSGSLADSGPGARALSSEGGTIGAQQYDFNPTYPGDYNQGLTLTETALSDPGIYSIEMRLKYDRLRNETPPGSYGPDQSWIKTIDYTNAQSSYGLYVEDVIRWEGPGEEGLIEFISSTEEPPYYDYTGISPDGVILADTWFHLVVTRDVAGSFSCFIDGVKVFEFDDVSDDAVVDAQMNTLRFFQPDIQAILEYNVYEVTKGSIDYLRIYDEALSDQEASELFSPLPLGDLNGDRDVDGIDLGIWQGGYAIDDSGDIDKDGDTDGRDFLIWQRNVTPTILSAETDTLYNLKSGSIPEPSTLMLAVLMGCMGIGQRCRRTNQ